MTTITQTLTLSQFIEAASAAPVAAAAAAVPFASAGIGSVAGGASFFPPTPLSPDMEAAIRSKLEKLKGEGCGEKIQGLLAEVSQFSSQGSEEVQRLIEIWLSQSLEIDFSDPEQIALSLAVLIFRVIHPILLNGASLAEQDQLFRWEDTCRDIIQQMLSPEESLESFLEETQKGLIEEQLFQERYTEINRIALAQLKALSSVGRKIEARIGQVFDSLSSRISALRDDRKKMQEIFAAQTTGLAQALNQIALQGNTTHTEFEELNKRDEQGLSFDSQKQQCRELAERLL